MSNNLESLLIYLAPEDRQEISMIPEKFMKRALKGDWEGVAELYHSAAIQMPPDQPEIEGREAIRDALSRTFGSEAGVKLEEFSVSVKEAEGIGSLIFVRAAYHLRMSVKTGQGMVNLEQHGPYINILRQDEEGHWRIYRQIYSRDHPPPMPDFSGQSEPERAD
jgi:ketosteroid isomerase-like protein